jgi:acyl CoA:acetate/3-ketoacid CoA transferase alpha subunit
LKTAFAEIPKDEGYSKIVPLEQAITERIKPDMDLHFVFAHSRAHAAAMEIVRQFNQQPMHFTLTGAGVLEYGIMLAWAGLVDRVVTGFIGDTFPSPAPNRFMQKLIKDKKMACECWTNLTVTLGLLAGALHVPYTTTKSLLGSDLIAENPNAFKVLEDPFTGQETVAIKALNPDLAIVHGLVADKYGNTIIGPPFGENMLGVYAAKKGAIVTVEKIVSTEEIRKLANYVKVPGHLVKSVSVVPYGAHPQGMSTVGIPSLEELTYSDDYQTRREFKAAARTQEGLDAWMQEWVMNTTSESYRGKLGASRFQKLHESAISKEAINNVEIHDIDENQVVTPSEKLIISTARIIGDKAEAGTFASILAGIGTAHLASWLAKYLYKNVGHQWELLTETGFYGYYPQLGDAYIFNYANIPTSKILNNFVDILGYMVSSELGPCMGLLSAAEVDQYGNFNSTKLPQKDLVLTSGGGSNDVASAAQDVIIVITHSPRRLVEKVSFVTGPGNKVKTIVTDKAVLRRDSSDEAFKLTDCFVGEGQTLETAIQEACQECAWDLTVAENVLVLPAPSRDELACLRALDPRGDIRG